MKRRSGFTIVELLVAMALIIFIMVILTEAFTVGLGTFRLLKAQGDMQEKLRSASIRIRKDLEAPHFEGYRKLSDPDFALTPPQKGFLHIRGTRPVQVPPAVIGGYEGTDADGVPSERAHLGDHVLHLSVQFEPYGLGLGDFMRGRVPPSSPNIPGAPFGGFFPPLDKFGPLDYQLPGQFNSQWAEVIYFLRPIPGATANGVPLFTLYRRQLLLATAAEINAAQLNGPNQTTPPRIPATDWGQYHDVSCQPDVAPNGQFLLFNTPEHLAGDVITATPLRRSFLAAPGQNITAILGERGENPSVIGDELLLSDVISFTIKVLPNAPGAWDFVDIGDPTWFPPEPWVPPFAPPPYYDTSPQNLPPSTPRFGLKAIQIQLRVWDFKTEQTRQVTIIQDM
jgi:hypothetical protein